MRVLLSLEGDFSHLQGSVAGLVSANKTCDVNELDAFDARNFLQLLVANAAPGFVQELAADEGAFLDRYALDAEVVGAAVEQDVLDLDSAQFRLDSTQMFLPWTETRQLHDFAGFVNVEAILHSLLDDVACWQPSVAEVRDFVIELFSNVLHRLVEEFVDLIRRLLVHPVGVESLDTARQMRVDSVLRFAIKLRNAVVDAVDFLDETLVNFDEDRFQLGRSEIDIEEFLKHLRDDNFAVVDVDQTSRAQSTIEGWKMRN